MCHKIGKLNCDKMETSVLTNLEISRKMGVLR